MQIVSTPTGRRRLQILCCTDLRGLTPLTTTRIMFVTRGVYIPSSFFPQCNKDMKKNCCCKTRLDNQTRGRWWMTWWIAHKSLILCVQSKRPSVADICYVGTIHCPIFYYVLSPCSSGHGQLAKFLTHQGSLYVFLLFTQPPAPMWTVHHCLYPAYIDKLNLTKSLLIITKFCIKWNIAEKLRRISHEIMQIADAYNESVWVLAPKSWKPEKFKSQFTSQ